LQVSLAQRDLGLDSSFPVTLIRREVPVGPCIPDLVYVRFLEMPLPSLWPTRWTYRHTYILWLLRRWKRLRLKTIAAHVYEPLEKVSTVLDELTESGAVAVLDTGAFTLSPQMSKLRAEVISVEVKLYRWKEALDQARKYKQFSDRTFVAMDKSRIPSSLEAIKAFRKLHVGLCAVSEETIDWIVPPHAAHPKFGPDKEYLVSAAASSSSQMLWSLR